MINEVIERATPMSASSMMEIIRSAHSCWTMSGYFRYNRSKVRAAFFFTNALDVLHAVRLDMNEPSSELTVR